jgi:hypothetical protein
MGAHRYDCHMLRSSPVLLLYLCSYTYASSYCYLCVSWGLISTTATCCARLPCYCYICYICVRICFLILLYMCLMGAHTQVRLPHVPRLPCCCYICYICVRIHMFPDTAMYVSDGGSYSGTTATCSSSPILPPSTVARSFDR